MQAPIRQFPLYLLWSAMAGLSLYLSYTVLYYFSFSPTYNFLAVKQDVVYNIAWRTSLYTHIAGGLIALALGPFQMIPYIRNRFLNLHRVLGRVYVVCILFIGAPAGFYMAFFANGGKYASLGFIILSLLWFSTTLLGVLYARRRQVEEHRRWMLRSFALTFAAVTLRLWVPILSRGLDVPYDITIIATAWLSWVPNILVAELIIHWKKIFSPITTFTNSPLHKNQSV